MQYKDDVRRLIDIVKQKSFEAPLEQTLGDMKTMANVVKDLSGRLENASKKKSYSRYKTSK